MSESIPERPDMRQLRTQAKELLLSLHAHEALAISLAAEHDPQLKPSEAKLADTQRITARKYGFDSWPKLVDQLETPKLLEGFKQAVRSGNAEKVTRLLKSKPVLRGKINEPLFNFGSTAIIHASGNPNAAELLPILIRYGADPNIRSDWWAGGYSALDGAKGETVNLLLSLGATFDVWSAAGHGRTDILEALLKQDPSLVNAPGGDGERPLHFASTPEVAELLIRMGADLEQRDVDHESTPIQYQVNSPDILRVLLKHGAKPDIFTAVALNDITLLKQLIESDPESPMARVGNAPYLTTQSDGGHIYTYRLGPGKSPQQLAVQKGFKEILDVLLPYTSPSRRLVTAAWLRDEAKVDEILKSNPGSVAKFDQEEGKAIPAAAQEGRTETVRLLLKAGFDPMATGMDSGTSLHVACWFGWVEVVRLLIGHVPLETGDAHHGSPPLGWALHGGQWCRNPLGDYPAVVRELIGAGANIEALANSYGNTMLEQAGDREDLKAILREARREA